MKAEKLPVKVNFDACFLSSQIRKRAVISFLDRNEPDVDLYRNKIDEFFPVKEIKQLPGNFRLIEQRYVTSSECNEMHPHANTVDVRFTKISYGTFECHQWGP